MLKILDEIFEDKNLDAIIISDGYSMRYLSGFSGETGFLYISKNKNILLTDSRYTVQAEKEAADFEVVQIEKGDYVGEIKKISQNENLQRVGFENESISYSEYIMLKNSFCAKTLVEADDKISALRIVKMPFEIENMKKAESIGDLAFEKILSFIKPGVTELEVAAMLEFYMKSAGAERLSFETIVASGINSSMPHAVPTNKKIEKGDFVTMDFGCKYNGYCSDMTRTVVVGKANDKQKEIYNIVLEAQIAGLESVKSGKKGWEIDKISRDIILKAGYGECFGHGLGHSVGLFIHESPRLSPSENGIIPENCIETVEPGIYIKGFGGVRIEDMVLVTKDGYENLAHSPKQLIEL